MRPAVFLDRDGVLIEDTHYLTDPGLVRLTRGAGAALRELKSEGHAIVVVTNQSAVGRGMLTEEGLRAIHDRMEALLAEDGVALDAIHHCPVVPEQRDQGVVEHPDRKPGPGMLLRAAEALNLDVKNSWMIGDMLSDMLAGRNAGVRATVLMRNPAREQPGAEHEAVDYVVDDLEEAARIIAGRVSRNEV